MLDSISKAGKYTSLEFYVNSKVSRISVCQIRLFFCPWVLLLFPRTPVNSLTFIIWLSFLKCRSLRFFSHHSSFKAFSFCNFSFLLPTKKEYKKITMELKVDDDWELSELCHCPSLKKAANFHCTEKCFVLYLLWNFWYI